MLKLRPAKDRYLGITEADCLEILNLTPDQLRIARALDREKVRILRRILADGATGDLIQECPEDYQVALSWLPTFDEEKADW